MNMIKSIVAGLVVTATFALSGCGDDNFKKFEGIVDKVCACKTSECVKKEAAAVKDLDEPKKSEMKKYRAEGDRMQDCIDTLANAEAAKAAE